MPSHQDEARLRLTATAFLEMSSAQRNRADELSSPTLRAGIERALALLVCALLAGCQALSGSDSVATIDADLTMYAAEIESIREVATAEQNMVVGTLAVASTQVAALSAENAALGATLRAGFTRTPAVRAVIVSAEDMGGSLEYETMDDVDETAPFESEMSVSNLSTAAGTDQNSGCSSGIVQQFNSHAERVYLTARVTSLRPNSTFSVDWSSDGRSLLTLTWQAEHAKAFECIWFYATPLDFPFLPGSYTVTLYVDDIPVGSTTFTISEE